jgi:hypothetical protein
MKKFFSLIWRGWMAFAHAVGWFNTRVLLTVTYFVIIAIAWIGTRLAGADLLDRKVRPRGVHYHDRQPFKDTLATCRRQF